MNTHPKLLKSLFNLTSDDERIPTDSRLDEDIQILGFYMHGVWPLLKRIVKRKLFLFLRYKWRIWAKKLSYAAILIVAIIFAWIKVAQPIFIDRPAKIITNEIYITNLKSFNEFLNVVGEHESGNKWDIVNEFGMLGRFQFAPSTLKSVGFNVDSKYFLNDTNMQISAFKRLLYLNKVSYQKYIDKWEGKSIPQDKRYIMTESGILMAFHLKPSDAVQYFESGCKNVGSGDAYGVKVNSVIKLYSGYRLDLVDPSN